MRVYKIRDVSGIRFGRLTALRRHGWTKSGGYTWECLCDCGATYIIRLARLNWVVDPACFRCAQASAAKTRVLHGKSRAAYTWYKSWEAMKARCLNPNNTSWAYYGGRGVKICKAWVEDSRAFFRDMGERPYGTSLDRIDPNGDYEPSNCRWADSKVQATNKRR